VQQNPAVQLVEQKIPQPPQLAVSWPMSTHIELQLCMVLPQLSLSAALPMWYSATRLAFCANVPLEQL
jgi:hypothetical protein